MDWAYPWDTWDDGVREYHNTKGDSSYLLDLEAAYILVS
jgi:hypothetical protein